jgi:hypothetical protein
MVCHEYQLHSGIGLAPIRMFVTIELWSDSAEYASLLTRATLLDRGIDLAPTARSLSY